MTLKDAIQKTTDSFSTGDLFDSHTIINELIKNPEYHLAYLQEYSSNCTVAQYHGLISQKIGSISGIESFGHKIKTHTIYGDISENELWKKV